MRIEPVPQNDDPPYRDYLVKILNEVVTKPAKKAGAIEIDPAPKPPPAQLMPQTLSDLRKRFKQDFATMDNAVIGANVVAVEVVTRVLTEDLGVQANAIPAQLGQANRAYLLQLIGLSGQTIEALGTTYRIDLTRSDLETTTRVRENILTLQQSLRDGTFTWANPFFHYKEEWRQQYRSGYFPENHYALKTGVFATSSDRNNAAALVAEVTGHDDYSDLTTAARFVKRVKLFFMLEDALLDGHRQFAAEEFALAESAYSKAQAAALAVVRDMPMKVYGVPASGDTYQEQTLYPALTSAETFASTLDPTGRFDSAFKHFFADPAFPTAMAAGKNFNTWHKYKTTSGEHVGRWEEGLEKGWWQPVDIPKKVPKTFPFTNHLFKRLDHRYAKRAQMQVSDAKSLAALLALNVASVAKPDDTTSFSVLDADLILLHDDLVSLLPHIAFFLLPICLGDVAEARGDVVSACGHYAQIVKEELMRGLLTSQPGTSISERSGDLPWSHDDPPHRATILGQDYPYLNSACEKPFIQLRIGKLCLSWADRLYRADREADVYRARELYKSVLRQYGLDPLPGEGLAPLPMRITERPTRIGHRAPPRAGELPITRTTSAGPGAMTPVLEGWIAEPPVTAMSGPTILNREVEVMDAASKASWQPLINAKVPPISFMEFTVQGVFDLAPYVVVPAIFLPLTNPAILAQQMRARIGLTQIDAGLNYFGYPHFLVPLLRYPPLATAAQRFAALAKQSEQDFLEYKEKAEREELALIKARGVVAAAALRVQIEDERIAVARDNVVQAGIQVQQVKDQIAAKQAEIADGDSLCTQVGDFFSGLKDFFSGVPDKAKDYVGSDYSAAFGISKASAGATAGAGVVGGMALFGIGAAVSLSGMADTANGRVAALKKLQNQNLPMAQANLDARQRELSIAQMQKAVATLEFMTEQEVLHYSQAKALNVDLWCRLSSAMARLLSRYLDIGAMTGWLAERALSYDQDRNIRILRLNYADHQPFGLLGADALQLDLSLLEKEYLAAAQQKLPIKWTLSLAKEFPLEFGRLKKTGACSFLTGSAPLDLAYPGSFGHRIRAVKVSPVVPVSDPLPRGSLSNSGISLVDDAEAGNQHFVIGLPGTMPLSEYDLEPDAQLFQIPGKALLPFEGSGIDTFWTLEYPFAANAGGLGSLADVEIVFYLEAQHSDSLRADLMAQGAAASSRTALFSARHLFAKSLNTFTSGAGGNALKFDITEALLPMAETGRLVTNVGVCFIGRDLPEIKAKLNSTTVPNGAKFETKAGLAHSRKQPQGNAPPAVGSPLDALVAGDPCQVWSLTAVAADNPNLVRKDVEDIVLGVEYSMVPSG